MSWQECEEKFIRKVSVDNEKIKSMIEMAKSRWKFVKSIKASEENVSFIFDDYYEIVKELLIALMLKKGLRSRNHQCLFTFFSKEYGYDAEVNVIKQMSFLRNRLGYYGEKVDYDYFKENHKSFEEIIKLLLGLLNPTTFSSDNISFLDSLYKFGVCLPYFLTILPAYAFAWSSIFPPISGISPTNIPNSFCL